MKFRSALTCWVRSSAFVQMAIRAMEVTAMISTSALVTFAIRRQIARIRTDLLNALVTMAIRAMEAFVKP